MSFALGVQRAMPKPMVANPGETVYIGGLPFTIYTSGRGIVRYRSTETRWEKVFKVLKDESVAALEARIAADLADLGIVVGTPRGLAAECATQAETSASSRPARQSGDKAKRSPEVHTGARAPSRQGDGTRTGRCRRQPSAVHAGCLVLCFHPRWPTCNGSVFLYPR